MKKAFKSLSKNIDLIVTFLKKPKNQLLLVLALLILATFLRFWKMEYVPAPDDADELAYIYAGQSLLKYGEPISWSIFTYEDINWKEISFDSGTTNRTFTQKFVRPWSDHPLLLPWIMGPLSLSAGYPFPSVPPALLYRLPMLFLSTITLWLAFLITKHYFGYWPAIFSLSIMTGSPSLIFAQRMVTGENVVILGLLAAWYFTVIKRKLLLAGIIALWSFQAKVVGLVIIPIVSMALALENNWKQALKFGVITFACTLAFYLTIEYGLTGDSFFTALSKQSFRLLGWSNPSSIFMHPGFLNYDINDFSYYLMLVLGLSGVTFLQKKKTQLIPAIIFVLFGLIWVTSGEETTLGWYKIPLFVVLAISSASWINEKRLFLPIALLTVAIANNLGLVRYPTHPLPSTELLRLGVVIVLFLILSTLIYVKKIKYRAIILAVLVVVYLTQAMYITDNYFEAKCTDAFCTVPTITFSGWVRELF